MKTLLVLLLGSLAGCTSTAQINRGQALFFTETFNGNGRTCATCHTPAEGFGISPKTIQALPADSPFFARNVPGLENLEMLRTLGLVTVSDKDVDGVNEL